MFIAIFIILTIIGTCVAIYDANHPGTFEENKPKPQIKNPRFDMFASAEFIKNLSDYLDE